MGKSSSEPELAGCCGSAGCKCKKDKNMLPAPTCIVELKLPSRLRKTKICYQHLHAYVLYSGTRTGCQSKKDKNMLPASRVKPLHNSHFGESRKEVEVGG